MSSLTKLPKTTERVHKGVTIGMYRENGSIVAYAKLEQTEDGGKQIEVKKDFRYDVEPYPSNVINWLNEGLSVHGLVLKHSEFDPIAREQLKKFYPEYKR